MGRHDRLQPRAGALPHRRDDGGPQGRARRALLGHEGGRALDRPRGLVRRLADKLAQCSAPRTPSPGPTSTSPSPSPPASSGSSRPRSRRSRGSSHAWIPAILGGNAVVAVASEASPLAAVELAEVLANLGTSPAGSSNLLTGFKDELSPWLAGHMDVNAIDLTGANGDAAELERLAADNVKRVVRGRTRRSEPVGGGCLPRAQDRLAPDRRLATRSARRSCSARPGTCKFAKFSGWSPAGPARPARPARRTSALVRGDERIDRARRDPGLQARADGSPSSAARRRGSPGRRAPSSASGRPSPRSTSGSG